MVNLTPDQKKALIEWLRPLWQKGYRHHIQLALSGLLLRRGIDLEDLKDIIKEVEDNPKDLQVAIRKIEDDIKVIKEKKKRIKELAGWNYLKSTLLNMGYTAIEIDNLCERLADVLNIKHVDSKEGNFIVEKKGVFYKSNRVECVVNRPNVGILYEVDKYNKEEERWEVDSREIVSRFWIQGIVTNINPLSYNEDQITVIIQTAEGETKKIEGYMEDVVKQMSRSIYVLNKKRAEDCIRAILSSPKLQKEQVVRIQGLKLGLFEYNGELFFVDEEQILITDIRDTNIEKLKEGLQALNRVASFYDSRKVKTVICKTILAPFGFVRKQNNLSNKILILHGEGGTGKTSILQLSQAIYGIHRRAPPFKCSGSSFNSPFRIATWSSETSFLIRIEEAKDIFIGGWKKEPKIEIIELLKELATELELRSYADRRGRGTYYGFAAIGMTTNLKSLPYIDSGWKRRTIAICFTNADKPKTTEERKAFDELKNDRKALQKLANVGKFILKLALSDWEEFKKKFVMEYDELTGGEKLLRKLYELAKMPVPDWLNASFINEESMEWENPIDYMWIRISKDLLELARKYKINVDGQGVDKWLELLLALKEKELPDYLMVGKKCVFIRPRILRILRKEGIEISFREVSEIYGIPTVPRKVSGKSERVLRLTLDEFAERLTEVWVWEKGEDGYEE